MMQNGWSNEIEKPLSIFVYEIEDTECATVPDDGSSLVNPDLDMDQEMDVFFKELNLDDPNSVPMFFTVKPTITILELKTMINDERPTLQGVDGKFIFY